MTILTKRPRPRNVIAGGYKMHAKMPTHVYSSYVSAACLAAYFSHTIQRNKTTTHDIIQ